MNNEPNFNNQDMNPNPVPQYTPDPFADKPQEAPKGLAIISLVLGILSTVGCCCCTPLCLAFGVVAVVLAVIYSKRAGNLDGMSLTGLILGIIGIVISLAMIIVTAANYDLFLEAFREMMDEAMSQGGGIPQ